MVGALVRWLPPPHDFLSLSRLEDFGVAFGREVFVSCKAKNRLGGRSPEAWSEFGNNMGLLAFAAVAFTASRPAVRLSAFFQAVSRDIVSRNVPEVTRMSPMKDSWPMSDCDW